MILFQNIVEILHRSTSTVLLQSALGFEPHDRRRVRAVAVGVDNAGHGMIFCRPNALAQEALCCGRVLLGQEEKVEGRAKLLLRKRVTSGRGRS
jgi:hypothetical protein